MFCISLTVFELFADNRFDRYRDAPSGENIFIRKPDPDFLLVVCWPVLPKSYRFRVIHMNSIRPLQRRPLAAKILFSKARLWLPITVFCWHFASNSNRFRVIQHFYSPLARVTWLRFRWSHRLEMTSPVDLWVCCIQFTSYTHFLRGQ
jgi:hypothetical protein